MGSEHNVSFKDAIRVAFKALFEQNGNADVMFLIVAAQWVFAQDRQTNL